MLTLRIALVMFVCLVLQTVLPDYWRGFNYLDLMLVMAVYLGLQRNSNRAMLWGAAGGLAQDWALATKLLGANSFTKTFIAYWLSVAGLRFRLDNSLMRLLVLLVCSAVNSFLYVFLHFFFAALPEGMTGRALVKIGLLQLAANFTAALFLFPVFDKLFREAPYDPTRAPEAARRKLS